MPIVVYVLVDGSERRLDVAEGTSVMLGAVQQGLPGIEAECGGCLSCATCHVYVDAEFAGLLDAPSEAEEEMLEVVSAERRPGSRLSCQIEMTPRLDGLTVRIPESQ
jgi:2Fe-2S ferredoxin